MSPILALSCLVFGANRDVIQTMDFLIALFFDGKSHVLCKNNSVQKTINNGLSKTLIRSLPYGTVW